MISVISSFRDEEENLGLLYRELSGVLYKVPFSYEIIFVDDYSDDGSWGIVEKIRQENPKVVLLKNKYHRGRGHSLQTGIEAAKGDKIIFLDSDTQDNPADVPKFLEQLNNGLDLVNGYRQDRKAKLIIRAYSAFFNWFLRTFYRSPFHDVNCGFKAFTRAVIEKTPFDPATFRFFPLAAFYDGFKVGEIKVENRPRVYGKSKFGIFKIFRGFKDFFRFIRKRRQQKTTA